MIDRDSYSAGHRGYDAFLGDARAILAVVQAYAALDRSLEVGAGSDESQRLIDGARLSVAAASVDEIATVCDLLADVAQEFRAPIEADLRAAKRLVDMTYAEAANRQPREMKQIEFRLADPTNIRNGGTRGGRSTKPVASTTFGRTRMPGFIVSCDPSHDPPPSECQLEPPPGASVASTEVCDAHDRTQPLLPYQKWGNPTRDRLQR